MSKFFFTLIILIALAGAGLLLTAKPPKTHSVDNKPTISISPETPVPSATTIPLSVDQLLSLASSKYADGNLPLGDNKFTTDSPKKGYIYLCHAKSDEAGGGAGVDGPWIHGNTWNINQKISVMGKNNWPTAKFSNTISGEVRTLAGNDLPTHPSGTFPIQPSDPAYQYDRNPNSIKEQSFSDQLPTDPTWLAQPECMGGEAGIMLTGVPIFNGFDAQLRDAAAHELQDSCQGHPQVWGEYHYHSLSSCINDVSVSSVIGFAVDGFPITGPMVTKDKYLTTDNLDECHGITSEINLDGKKVTMYHYVMTMDFPYSVSCFRGHAALKQVIPQSSNSQNANIPPNGGALGGPPPESGMMGTGHGPGNLGPGQMPPPR